MKIFLFCLLIQEVALAGTPITFEEAVKIALEKNSNLAALRSQHESLKQKSKLALAPNDPVFSYLNNNTSTLSPTARGASQAYQIAWTLGFPGKAFASSDNLDNQANAARELSKDGEIATITAVSNSFVANYIDKLRMDLIEQEIIQGKNIVHMIERMYGNGTSGQVDLLSAKAALTNTEYDQVTQNGQHQATLTQFRNVIKKPEDKDLEPVLPSTIVLPEITLSSEEMTRLMLNNNNKLKSSVYQVKSAEAALTLANLSPFPDFQFQTAMTTYNVASAQPDADLARDYSFTIGISLPIFFPFNEMVGIQAAKRDLQTAKHQDDAVRLQAAADLRANLTQYTALRKRIDKLKDYVVPINRASYDMILRSYGFGKADYLRLKDARQAWIDSQFQMISNLSDAAVAYNQMVNQVGCDFAKKGNLYECK